jgi:hypothetical protein
MHDDFEQKVRAAAVAGWWTLLVAAAAVLFQWAVYQLVVPSRLTLVLTLWGSDSWAEVQHLWLLGTIILKLLLFVMALLCLWLTLWARQLRKGRGA